MVVDAVENWLKKLPVDGDEKTAKSIKDDLAKRWFKKVGEINSDPKIFGDDDLYQDLLNEEIDAQLEIIPSSNKLGENKDKMKTEFINAILEARKIMKYKSAGDDYVHRLINKLDASIPNPVAYQQINDPGFEIYKNKLANLFILSNFDHCNDDFKIPYEKKIREEVNKYVTHAANRNAIPLTNDQINNELFSVLFKVPFPNEESIVNEVEELKTKIIIDSWYEELPLGEPHNGLIELLERDKILSTLAKRIHELEREEAPAEKVLKEIKKWMGKFPFEIKFRCKFDFYATKLLNKLISTIEERKCFVEHKKGVKGKEKRNEIDNHHIGLSIEPNNKCYNWKNSTVSPCCQLANFEERNPTELILEMIEVWFEKLPIKANDEELKILKTDAVTKMVLKISELNADPDILYDDMTYYALVNQELDKVLSNLPLCCDFPSTSDYKKREFVAVLQNIKPLLIDEKARHEYKKELKDTVNSILEPPKESNEEKSALFNHFKDELVEEFVQYYYTKGDEKGRQFYKNKVHDTVLKYIQEILKKQQQNVNPLILRNQLICELEKIPIPSEIALKHNVEEIRMKAEVAAFLNENSLTPKNKVQENVMTSLAKKLFEIERTGHTCDNERKMKAEIFKNTRKLGKELSSDKVDAFLNRLKETEPIRKAPPPRDDERAHQMLKKGNDNNITNWIPIQNDFSSDQAGRCDARYITSRRQVGPQPPIANSNYSMFQYYEPNYYSGSSNTTSQSLMNIEHLVQDADRWRESNQVNTNRLGRMIPSINNYNTERAQPYSTVDIDPRQIEMQQLTNFQTAEQPILERTSFQPADVRSQVLPCESFQVISHGQTQSQSSPRLEAPPSQLLYGPVNLSCSPCRNPCPLRTSPDQVDPCDTERAYTRNNQIQSSCVQDIDSNFGRANVPGSKPVPIQPQAALNQSLHDGLHIPQIPLYGQDHYQPNIQAPTTTYIPNDSQVQIPEPTILEQSIAGVHTSTQPFSCENNAAQVSSCCQNVQPHAAPFMSGGNQMIIPEQTIIGTNRRPQVDVQSNLLPAANPCMYNASQGQIPGQSTVAANTSLQPSSPSVRQGINLSPCLPSIQRTASGTAVTPAELFTAQMSNNKDDILKRPMTNDAHTQLMPPGQIRRQPPRKKVKLRDAREISEDVDIENGDVDNVLCKCGRRRARRRKYYDDDFEMCFGRLPRCYYY
ncbi:hypothetical protein K1T71_014061 [Dendrolimus kikuchii]|uniref:Uncharacterized protein n=1 Tax=Dendrolimus kikuchii TaxID=765133 RepID=A0ACC1CEW9_9NEOP|nr:hypothetical protein K1T71_014061 [Dendrolimus kikuchii]